MEDARHATPALEVRLPELAAHVRRPDRCPGNCRRAPDSVDDAACCRTASVNAFAASVRHAGFADAMASGRRVVDRPPSRSAGRIVQIAVLLATILAFRGRQLARGVPVGYCRLLRKNGWSGSFQMGCTGVKSVLASSQSHISGASSTMRWLDVALEFVRHFVHVAHEVHQNQPSRAGRRRCSRSRTNSRIRAGPKWVMFVAAVGTAGR